MRTIKLLIFLIGTSFADEDQSGNGGSIKPDSGAVDVGSQTEVGKSGETDSVEKQERNDVIEPPNNEEVDSNAALKQKLTFQYTIVIDANIDYTPALSDKKSPEYAENAAAVEKVFQTDLTNAGNTKEFSLIGSEATFSIVYGAGATFGKTQLTLDSSFESDVLLTTDLHELKSSFLETLEDDVVAAVTKSDGTYIAKNAKAELSGQMKSDTCHGPTAFIADGKCNCASIRGMTYDRDLQECACNGRSNFYWNEDEGECSCEADYDVDFDGKCRKVTESIEWTRPWTQCATGIKVFGEKVNYGKRSNVIRKFDCKAKDKATEAPWFDCDSTKIKEYELCQNSDDVICADPRATYKTDKGKCICDDELFWTKYGCRTFPTNKSPADAIIAQIDNRLRTIISHDEFQTKGKVEGKTVSILKSQKRKTFKYWKQAERQARNANKRCGRNSRAANPRYPTDIDDIHKTFTELSATATTSIPDLIKLMKLFDSWSKKSLFECDDSGYGNDPTDGVTDKNGAVCDKSNGSKSFKCRLRFEFTNLFNQYSLENQLSW